MDLHIYTYIILAVMAFLAGTVDTLAGGGGLITVPAQLLSGVNPIIALGTDKLQSAIGELSATLHFLRHGNVRYRLLLWGLIYTMLGAAIGTILLQFVPVHHLEKIIPILLLAVLIYYLYSSYKGKINPKIQELSEHNSGFFASIGSLIGFYNGFFGPGTGTLWAISFMHFKKLSIQQATMYTKPLNLAANLIALGIFIVNGQVDFSLAFIMGIGSFLGGKFGAQLVIYKDSRWLKLIFTLLMSLSVVGTFIKYYFL
ncbi:MAG: hypothetical protein EKK57_01165 [Proteobacteria bacterium]|nr:MAG: hypothetical protein EKK57_01165 [Pseudomonadota bacterium]